MARNGGRCTAASTPIGSGEGLREQGGGRAALQAPIPDQHRAEDTLLAYQVPADTFSDADGDALTYAATLADGSALPAWLHFDAATRTFSGTPPQDFNGTIAVKVAASDGSATASDNFDLVIDPVNDAPAVTSPATASVAENSPTGTIVYQATATDADGDAVSWSLGGADAGLLSIDANGAIRLISAADYETRASYSFSVIASDAGSSSPKPVTLNVTNVIETPVIAETGAANDTIGLAQAIDRATLVTTANPNLVDDDLPSATITGNISASGDRDFFSITLQAGEQLILDVDGTTNGLDSLLALYRFSGALIGTEDDLVSADPGSGMQFGHNTDSQIVFRAATSGTYYFSIGSYADATTGGYQLHVSIGPPTTLDQRIAEDIEALDSGTSWNHLNLTYGFPTVPSQYPDSFTEPDNGFARFTATQQVATRSLLQFVANVTAITFTENTAAPGNADIRYAMSNEPDVAYAYYPTNGGPSSTGGTAWFNHFNFNAPVRGGYAWMGILHETGHTLGLKHGHEFPLAIGADRDSVEYTVMTYRSYPGQDLSVPSYTNETWGYPQTLMMYDIAALQQLYGANFTFNSGDSVYSWSPVTGEMSIDGVGQGAPGNGASGANRVFLTIWDGGGNDTYDLSSYGAGQTNGATIDLRPGEWTTMSQAQLANLGQGHFARGNVANALLYLGDARSLIENAIGSQLGDTIIANQAANRLTGNGGADTFKWVTSADVGTGALADTIMDFARGSDRLDLSNIDAKPGTLTKDGFSFLGTAAFSHVAGEVRYDVVGGSAHVFADLDGNGVADMEIVVTNVTTFTRADFLLSLPPAVAHEIDDAHGTEDAGPFSFQIPADAFADPEGDALSYVATLANGDPLPSWVSFDAATRTFSASPPHDFFGNFSVKVTVSDQDSSVSDTFELFVHGVNDAPVLTATGSASSFTEGSNGPGTPVIVDPGLTLIDVDDVNMINATVGMSFGGPGDVLTFVNNDAALYGDIHQTNPAGGGGVQLSSSGAATLAQWQNALRSITYSNSSDDPGSFDRVVSFIVTDGAAFSNTVTKTVHIQPVNDSPRGTDATVTIAEDQAVVLSRADFGYSDPENYGFIQIVFTGATGGTLFYDADGAGGNAPVAVATFPASFSVSELDVGHLTFRPAANLSGAGAASISFQVQDSGGTDNGGHDTDPTPNTITYNVTAVNDAPLVDLNGAGAGTGGALAYTENAPLTAIAPGAVVGDPDTANYRDGHLLVQMSQGVNGQDVLAIINQGTGPGQIGYSNGVITYEGIKIGDLLPSSTANFPVLDIRFTNADVSLAALQALVRAARARSPRPRSRRWSGRSVIRTGRTRRRRRRTRSSSSSPSRAPAASPPARWRRSPSPPSTTRESRLRIRRRPTKRIR